MGNASSHLEELEWREVCHISAVKMYGEVYLNHISALRDKGISLENVRDNNSVTFHINFNLSGKVRGMAVSCPFDRRANTDELKEKRLPKMFELSIVGDEGYIVSYPQAGYIETLQMKDATHSMIAEEAIRVKDIVEKPFYLKVAEELAQED